MLTKMIPELKDFTWMKDITLIHLLNKVSEADYRDYTSPSTQRVIRIKQPFYHYDGKAISYSLGTKAIFYTRPIIKS